MHAASLTRRPGHQPDRQRQACQPRVPMRADPPYRLRGQDRRPSRPRRSEGSARRPVVACARSALVLVSVPSRCRAVAG